MRCEEARALLPELAEGALRAVGTVEMHLASCPQCSQDLRVYRSLLLELAFLRDDEVEAPEGFLERLLADLPEAHRRRLLARVAADGRVQYAAFSVGGAVVGATAIGLLWWRAVRRGGGSERAHAAASTS
jgi:hypothetical protein